MIKTKPKITVERIPGQYELWFVEAVRDGKVGSAASDIKEIAIKKAIIRLEAAEND